MTAVNFFNMGRRHLAVVACALAMTTWLALPAFGLQTENRNTRRRMEVEP